MSDVRFEDNSKDFERELEDKINLILFAWGLKWQELATKTITSNGIVDTGRLRASLSFATPDKSGYQRSVSQSEDNDFISHSPEKTLTIGSNVVYASKQELTNPKGAFVGPAWLNYKDTYKQIAEEILKGS